MEQGNLLLPQSVRRKQRQEASFHVSGFVCINWTAVPSKIEMCQQLALLILNNLIVLPKTTLGDKSYFSGCEILNKKYIYWQSLQVYRLKVVYPSTEAELDHRRKGLFDIRLILIECSFALDVKELFFWLDRGWDDNSANSMRQKVQCWEFIFALLSYHRKKVQWIHWL